MFMAMVMFSAVVVKSALPAPSVSMICNRNHSLSVRPVHLHHRHQSGNFCVTMKEFWAQIYVIFLYLFLFCLFCFVLFFDQIAAE